MAIGIYIHIPFCKSKCNYCDFNSYAGLDHLHRSYCNALISEINSYKTTQSIDSIYFGGGTPTVLPTNYLKEVLDSVKNGYNLTTDCEITIECNPATVSLDGFKKLHSFGFNRISLGLQSSCDAMLKRLGRSHTFQDFKDAFSYARQAGFENISLDLMYGLPDQTLNQWIETLKDAIAFNPEHISLYALKIEDGTPFSKMELNLPDDDTYFEMYQTANRILAENGLLRYEISNFAKEGFESRHNSKYWKCHDFLGFGAGAYSCIDDLRYSNIKNVESYIESENKVIEKIPLSLRDRMSEFCFLGLRLTEGISALEFKKKFNLELYEVFGEEIEKNLKRKTLRLCDGRLVIPDEYLFVSNQILSDFV